MLDNDNKDREKNFILLLLHFNFPSCTGVSKQEKLTGP